MPRSDSHLPNASWATFFCPACGLHRATLCTTRTLDAGDEVVVDVSHFPDQDMHSWPLEVSLDGGARNFGDHPKGAGAGATLWHHPPDGGAPTLLASCVLAMPDVDNAWIAAASGCRAALALLAATQGGRGCAAQIVGNNLAVIRYVVGNSRFRRLVLQARLEQRLGPLAATGCSLSWQAVRRRLDKAADRLATRGAFWAEARRRASIASMRAHIAWHAHPPAPPPAFFPRARGRSPRA